MPTVLCYGDSNTHGADPAGGERFTGDVRWPGVLRRELRNEVDVIEEGLNGRTTVWDDPFQEGRNGRAYLLPCLLSHEPVDLVVLLLGTNDLKAIYGLDAPRIAAGASTLVEIIQRSATGPGGRPPRTLLVVPPPVGATTTRSELWGFGRAAEESRRLPTFYRTVAAETGCDLLDSGAHVAPSPLDGVHLDAEGHARLGLAIAVEVRRILGLRP